MAGSALLSPPESEPIGGDVKPLAPGDPLLVEAAERRPWRMLLDVAVCYACFVFAVALLRASPTWPVAVLAFVLIGNRQYALSILTHDGSHRTLFNGRSANDLFCEIFLCAPVGVDFLGERRNHLLHHARLATEEDPDRHLYSAEDKATLASFLLFLTGLASFPRALAKALRGGATPQAADALNVSFLRRRGLTIVAQAAIFAAMSRALPWWCYFAFWIGPIYPLVFVPHKIRMFCEHAQPVVPDAAADGRRLVTFLPGLLERKMLSPFNLNHHVEHHLWPHVPYYNLPRLHEAIRRMPDVEVRGGYVAFLFDYLRRLPLA